MASARARLRHLVAGRLGLERLFGELLGHGLRDDRLGCELRRDLLGGDRVLGERDGLLASRIRASSAAIAGRRECVLGQLQVRGQVHRLAAVGARERLRPFLDPLEREREATPVAVDLEDQHVDRIALGDDLARVLDMVLRELGDVDEPLDARAGSRRRRRT